MALSSFEVKVDNAAATLKAQMVDVCSNPVLMLNFTPSVPGVAHVDLTQEEDAVIVPLLRGNIAPPRGLVQVTLT